MVQSRTSLLHYEFLLRCYLHFPPPYATDPCDVRTCWYFPPPSVPDFADIRTYSYLPPASAPDFPTAFTRLSGQLLPFDNAGAPSLHGARHQCHVLNVLRFRSHSQNLPEKEAWGFTRQCKWISLTHFWGMGWSVRSVRGRWTLHLARIKIMD